MNVKDLSISSLINRDKTLFEDVAKGYTNAKDVFKTSYTLLDYCKIIDDIIEYVSGYVKYLKDGEDKYKGKVLTITKTFYDSMFTDKKYRRKMAGIDMYPSINNEYLVKVKEFKALIESYLVNPDIKNIPELNSLIRMTNNQYKNLQKVVRDDMKIYLWIINGDSKLFKYHIDDTTRTAFNNKKTPVIHVDDSDSKKTE